MDALPLASSSAVTLGARCRLDRAAAHHSIGRALVALAMLIGILTFTQTSAEAMPLSDVEDHCWIVADGSGGTSADWLSDYDLISDTETTAPTGTATTAIEAMAFHYPSGRLFATNVGQFGEISLVAATYGTFIPIGPGGLGDVDGLSFDSTTGNLWGTVRNVGNDELIRIDFNTGTQLGASVTVATTVYSGPLNAGGSTNLLDIDDLAIDPVTGTTLAIANGTGTLDMLVTIDPVTGATTPIGSPADSGFEDIEGLGFTPAGDLIGTAGTGGGVSANSIVDIAKADGTASLRNDGLTHVDHEAVDCLTNAFLDPAIGLEKATNTIDADTPTGPFVDTNGTVTWSYEITNSGNLPLFDLALSDDIEGAVTCSHPQPLFPGESTTCTLTASSVTAGQYANVGTIIGTPVDLVGNGYVLDPTTGEWLDADGNPADFSAFDVAGSSPLPNIDDTDPSHYFGADPQIAIEKATNGDDADTPTGPSVVVGSTVTWTYEVTNPGNVLLGNVQVIDDNGTPGDMTDDIVPTFVGGDTNSDGFLDTNETWTYTANGMATLGQYANNAVVTGVGPETSNPDGTTTPGEEVSDDDPSHYIGAPEPEPEPELVSAIDIEKDTNGNQADLASENATLDQGAALTWTYVITNTGSLDLIDVVVVDDVEGAVCTIASLAIGESTTCTLIGTAGSTDYRNLGSVSGQPVDDAGDPVGDPVSDSDASGYDVTIDTTVTTEVDMKITKVLEGTLPAGGMGSYVLTVENLGPDTATGVTVVDVLPTGLTFKSATGDGWTCSADGQTVTCTRASVAPGEVVPTIRLAVDVAAETAGATIVNSATVESVETDNVPSNDRSDVTSTTHIELAFTGASSTTLTLASLLMIGSGLVLVSNARRRRLT